MQSICHMLFFPNILTVHQNALNQYTQVCAHNRGSELELVQLGGLPLLQPPEQALALPTRKATPPVGDRHRKEEELRPCSL